MQRLKATVDRAQPGHFPRPYRGSEAFDLDSAEIVTFEKLANEPSRRVVAQHAAGLGHSLEPGGQIGGFTHHPSLLRAAVADQIAHDYCPGRNTHSRREPGLLPFKMADPLHEGEAG